MEIATQNDVEVLQFGKRRKGKIKSYRDQGKGINRDFVLPVKTERSY